jgi:hypothetical protein
MSRTIPANTAVELAKRLGTELTPFVEIAWPSGTQYYSYTTRTLGGRNYQGKLLEFETVQYQGKQTATAQVSSVSIKLDDTDDSLRILLNQHNAEHIVAKVYINYPVLSSTTDNILLMIGKVTSDIAWSEADRALSFTIDTFITNNEVGYAPAAGDFTGLLEEAIDQPWPLCFGSVLKVPAQRIIGAIEGTLETAVYPDTTEFYVSGGEKFPQGVYITVMISGVTMQGVFNGTHFTVTTMSMPQSTGPFGIAARPDNNDNPLLFWLSSYVNLENKFFLASIDGQQYVNYCTDQNGLMCTMSSAFSSNELATTGDTIDEASVVTLSKWDVDSIINVVDLPSGNNSWEIADGTVVKYWAAAGRFDAYVANLLPSTVSQVLGKRTFHGMSVYTVIPYSYYTIVDGTALTNKNCTLIKFAKPLNEYENEGWSGDIYVSLRSSQPSGDVAPKSNTANIIKWLLDTYATGLTTDSASFSAVASKIANYPSSFAVFDQQKVIQLCEDIAWQARCALLIENDVVYLRYLSQNPVNQTYIEAANTLENSLVLGLSSFDSIVTKLTATWKHNYSGDEDSQHEYVYRNNISTYGLVEQSRDFFIYNIEGCVQASARFWGYRYSHIWRTATLQTLIRNVHLQVFDIAELNYAVLGDNSINGVIELATISPNTPNLDLSIEIAANAGTVVENPLYWWVPGIDLSTIKDPLTGLILEDDTPVIEDDTTASGLGDPNNPTDRDKYLVWMCTPSYIYQGQVSTFRLGLYDAAVPHTPPINQSVWVEIETIGYTSASTGRVADIPKQYVQITAGLSSINITVPMTHGILDHAHFFARAVSPDLDELGQIRLNPSNEPIYRRVTDIRPSRTDDIPVQLPEDGNPLAGLLEFVTTPTTIERRETFNVTVKGKEGLKGIFHITSNTDDNDVLGAEGIEREFTGGLQVLQFSVVGGSGSDTFTLTVAATPKECDPDEDVYVESNTINISEPGYEIPSGDPDDSNYSEASDPAVNPEQLMDIIQFDEQSSAEGKTFVYKVRKIRILADGSLRITDFGPDWIPLFTASPCP